MAIYVIRITPMLDIMLVAMQNDFKKWLGLRMLSPHPEILKDSEGGGTPWFRLARIMVTIHIPQNHG